MSIVTAREIGKIRQIERISNSRFHKRDIPDGAEVVRKKLFHYLEQIEAAEPIHNFGELYQKSIFDKLQHLEKDELINRLIWLQLKEAITEYENAPDLNIAFKSSPSRNEDGRRGGYTRLFINLGTKDGINPAKLVQFVSESIDIDQKLIDRVTVRELSSFFNVPDNVVEYVMQNISQQKYKSRKVRVEEADKKPMFKERGGGNSGFKRGDGDFNKKSFKRQDVNRNDSPKFIKARKPNNRY
jgi:ATP-dependent RNA helicase DeaD